MTKFTCMAVDDNPDALQIIVRLINNCDCLILLHAGTDPRYAHKLITEKKVRPDIIFLDLKMPGFWGFDFAESTNGSLIIYTTAYREFWSDALDKDTTVHYLLKPIFLDKFNKAIVKATAILEQNLHQEIVNKPPEILPIPGDGKQQRIRIKTANINYCEACSNYTDVHMEDGKVITTFLTLKMVEELLVKPWFARVQKSYFVNVAKVTKVDAKHIYIGEKIKVPIGPKYKASLVGLLIDENTGKP